MWILTPSRGQDVSTRSWYTQDSVLENLKFYPQGFVKKRYVDFIYRVCSLYAKGVEFQSAWKYQPLFVQRISRENVNVFCLSQEREAHPYPLQYSTR